MQLIEVEFFLGIHPSGSNAPLPMLDISHRLWEKSNFDEKPFLTVYRTDNVEDSATVVDSNEMLYNLAVSAIPLSSVQWSIELCSNSKTSPFKAHTFKSWSCIRVNKPRTTFLIIFAIWPSPPWAKLFFSILVVNNAISALENKIRLSFFPYANANIDHVIAEKARAQSPP